MLGKVTYNDPLLYAVADQKSEILAVSRSINKTKTIITKA